MSPVVRRMTVILVSLCGIWSGWRLLAALSATPPKPQLTARMSQVDSKSSPTRPVVSSGMRSVAALQAEIDRLARARECVVSQFQAGNVVGTYVSLYEGSAPATPGVGAVEATVLLKGPASQLLAMLRELNVGKQAFELRSFEMSRDSIDSAGRAICNATLKLLVIVPTGGPS